MALQRMAVSGCRNVCRVCPHHFFTAYRGLSQRSAIEDEEDTGVRDELIGDCQRPTAENDLVIKGFSRGGIGGINVKAPFLQAANPTGTVALNVVDQNKSKVSGLNVTATSQGTTTISAPSALKR